MIVTIPNPTGWWRWKEAERLLEPARARGDFPSVIEPDEALFVVFDGQDMLAAATAWLSTDGIVEVKLIGGRDYRRWIAELDERIGALARGAGATRLVAIGRRGWMRSIERLGWVKHGESEDHWVFVREL